MATGSAVILALLVPATADAYIRRRRRRDRARGQPGAHGLRLARVARRGAVDGRLPDALPAASARVRLQVPLRAVRPPWRTLLYRESGPVGIGGGWLRPTERIPYPVPGARTVRGGAVYRQWAAEVPVGLPDVRLRVRSETASQECLARNWGPDVYVACIDTWPGSLGPSHDRRPALGAVDRYGFVHELGHVFESRMRASAKRKFVRIMGYPVDIGRPDWQRWTQPEPVSGAYVRELFADAFARCVIPGVATGYPWRATPEQQAAVCALIAQEAAVRGWRLP